MAQNLYSPQQVAERLGLHVRTIRNYVRDGRLRAVRIGKQYRIAPKDLAKLTGQAPSAFESRGPGKQHNVEVSSIVDADGIAPEMATRISNLLTAAANGRKRRDAPSRTETIYDPDRMHIKIILVGTMEDNATFFSLISGIIKS
jgi:excisionase family DNA binding protein